ncbi:hypothetical protein PUN28_010989 [Cardiocondyla obscurior]|uniref:Uncharacterized protein n=1 Tax=Cardiocondyla obscurior TaxID=286306 RepID=A0AAW2FM95_9HYME
MAKTEARPFSRLSLFRRRPPALPRGELHPQFLIKPQRGPGEGFVELR